MSQTVIIKNPKGDVVAKFRKGRAVAVKDLNGVDLVGAPANWPWPEMPVSRDKNGVNVLDGYTAELIAKAQKPATPLHQIKTNAITTVNNWRRDAEEMGFNFKGKRVQSDRRSADRIQGGVKMADIIESRGGKFSQDWIMEDNSKEALDKTAMEDMFLAMGEHIKVVFDKSQVAKKEIRQATNHDEVRAAVKKLFPEEDA